jgi:hypothetical protein
LSYDLRVWISTSKRDEVEGMVNELDIEGGRDVPCAMRRAALRFFRIEGIKKIPVP